MPNSLTGAGLTTASQAELLADITANLQSIYGSDIDLSSNTPDGQWVNINIQAQLDVQELLMNIYNSFDPDNAIGTQLDQRCAINGIERQAGTYSVTNITVVITATATLWGLDQTAQQIFTVSDGSGNQWFLQTSQVNVSPGTYIYSFQAAIPGVNVTIPGTINVIVTVVLGVSSVNNPTAQSIFGINEETDASLRIRRQMSVSISSQGYLQGLLGALENINGIDSALVYENTSSSTDTNGVPGHSIWVIVDGVPVISPVTVWSPVTIYSYGQIVTYGNTNYISWQNNNINNAVTNTSYWGIYNPVAETIYDKRNAGCGMFGSTSYNITQIDNSIFTVYWDIVTNQNVFISFTATSINGINPPNIAGIIAGLVANYTFSVNEEININQMATIVQAADSNCLVTNAGFNLSLVQVLNLSGIAASGTFKLTYGPNSTAAINYNDSTSTIQGKIQAVSGLSTATVAGSLFDQQLRITLNTMSALTLILPIDNSLATSSPATITFSTTITFTNTLSPSSKKNQFTLSASNIIILPMILSPTSIVIGPSPATQQFTGLGGYGNNIYSLQTNVSGGNINSSTGLYTAGSTPGTDIALVTDAFGNTATATIVVT